MLHFTVWETKPMTYQANKSQR